MTLANVMRPGPFIFIALLAALLFSGAPEAKALARFAGSPYEENGGKTLFHILDAETGLYYFDRRYYDEYLGRFIQADDTIADLSNPQSYNRYSYCLNDPLRYTGPDGRAPSDWANAWSSTINAGASYVSAGPSHWIYNGTVGTLNSLVGGVAEPLRFGSTAGALSGSGNATARQIAVGTVQEVGRAAAIVPVGAAIGKGVGTLTGVVAGTAQREAVGEVAGTAESAVHRVVTPGKAQFQLRSGEQGLSVFDASKVSPGDILSAFREGSQLTTKTVKEIEGLGLKVEKTPGDANLPQHLQEAHMEIRPGPNMTTRPKFKQAIKKLEPPTQ